MSDPNAGSAVGMRIDGINIPFLFTNWSRGQVLAHVGAKEKWFRSVSLERQVEELNMRRLEFADHKLRLVQAAGDEPIGLIRGMVSDSFTDIPDTDVMKAIVEVGGDSYALRDHSAKTDRAFYAHIISNQEIGLSGGLLHGFPGVVIKNSEVGYTALHVIPVLFIPAHRKHIVFSKMAALRRVHRGSITELVEQFRGAIERASATWLEVSRRSALLTGITYPSEDDAVLHMKTAIVGAGGTKKFALMAEHHYRGAKHTLHTALSIFESVLAQVSSSNVDEQHLESALAGAVLWALT